jgi:DNA-binding response OmpR family regulator
LFDILIIARESQEISELYESLLQKGFTCSIAPVNEQASNRVTEQTPDAVLVEIDNQAIGFEHGEFLQMIKSRKQLPVIALISKETLANPDDNLNIVDDFTVWPCDAEELVLRTKRLLRKVNDTNSNELINCGDLVIDTAKCEVSVNGKLVELTFKEYELLKFLTSNRERVFTRDALLNKVWGYDYYGGDRTVDVHIRRLRSKIEDSNHAIIDTVRNVGYRFKCA